MNANLFNEIYNGLDHAMSCYLDTKAAKAGNVVKIYGTDFGGEFGEAQNLNSVEMYAIYSNRKNKSGKYNLKGFNVIVTNFETGDTETFESVTEAMEFVAHLMNEENNDTDDFEAINDIISNEACEMTDKAENLYNEAREISDRIGVMLHYTDNPDDENEELIDLAMEMRNKLYQIKQLREDFIDRANDLTGCYCVMEDFISARDFCIDGFDLKYDDPDDIFDSLWNMAWQCFDGHRQSTNLYNEVLYGFAA